MILTDYSRKLKKIRQTIAVILGNLEERFYSEKARKIDKMWKNVANYFLEQQGWTHFFKRTFLLKQNIIQCGLSMTYSWIPQSKLAAVFRCTSWKDHTVHHFKKLSKKICIAQIVLFSWKSARKYYKLSIAKSGQCTYFL